MRACIDAKTAKGEVVHVDASLIRAEVAWESFAVHHVDAVADANGDDSGRDLDARLVGRLDHRQFLGRRLPAAALRLGQDL